MFFKILVTMTTAVVPLVTGGYNYEVPSRLLEQPYNQPPYNYGQNRVHNHSPQNVQYQNNIITQNLGHTVNSQQPLQSSYNYQIQPNQVFPPLPYKEQRSVVYQAAMGVQPPNIRNLIQPLQIQNTHINDEITSPVAVQSQATVNNQGYYQVHTAAPVYYGYQPTVSQTTYTAPQTVQLPNQAITSQVINRQTVQQQQQHSNVQISQEQAYISNNDVQQGDEETVVEEEVVSYSPNYGNEYSNQQSNVQLSNSVTVNNIVGGNAVLNSVVNPVDVSYDTSIPIVNTPQTIITKHVYFHAPPPDIEEASAVQTISRPAKKTYNIIFVKVPSQDYLNRAEVLKRLQARQNSVDKTLIYVLVKNQESLLPVLGQKSQPSKPEVFFVKYKDDRQDLVPAALESSTSLISQEVVNTNA